MVNEKKINGNSGMLCKVGIRRVTHFTLYTSKTENFKKVIFIMKVLP